MLNAPKTVLVTGGSSGIGLALAEALAGRGHRVLAVGRSEAKLDAARRRVPSLQTLAADVADADDRERVVAWAEGEGLDVLVNNAGTMRALDVRGGPTVAGAVASEIAVDLTAPVDLSLRLLPHLLSRPEAAVVNVTTGLVYAPSFAHPAYAAAKAGLHAWTRALRHQLRGTAVRVVEVLPPAVDTPLNTSDDPKVAPEAVAEAVVDGLDRGRDEVRVGQAKALRVIAALAPPLASKMING